MPTTINLRIALWMLLGMALVLNYQMWTHDYVDAVPPPAAGANAAPAAPLDSAVPTANLPASAPAAAPVAGAGTAASTAGATAGATADSKHALVTDAPLAASVHVVTDVLDAEVSLAGGELRRVDLPTYPAAKNTPDGRRRFAVRAANGARAQQRRDRPDASVALQQRCARAAPGTR
jgi:YidC/Oxa1 family membrane protein insertase